MNKYYFSKTNDYSQAENTKKAIIIDGSQIKFYKNGELCKSKSSPINQINLSRGRALFENLQNINYNKYNSFFTNASGNNHSIDDNQLTNAFAYMKANYAYMDANQYSWPS